MASALLRASARRGSTFRSCFVSAARSGGEGLAARPVSFGRCRVRRLSNSATPGDQLPGDPNEKFDVLLEELRARANALPDDVATRIFISSMHARQECYEKQLSRSWMTACVLVGGGFFGYYLCKHNNIRDGAHEGSG